MSRAEKMIADLLDPEEGRKRLANQIAKLLLDNDEFVSLNALIAATAVFVCEPGLEKSEVVSQAKEFGESVAAYIEEFFEGVDAVRRRYEAAMA